MFYDIFVTQLLVSLTVLSVVLMLIHILILSCFYPVYHISTLHHSVVVTCVLSAGSAERPIQYCIPSRSYGRYDRYVQS